jgi:hypothetical protein
VFVVGAGVRGFGALLAEDAELFFFGGLVFMVVDDGLRWGLFGCGLPGLRTARHSSGVRSSGYDVMVFLLLALVPNKAPKKGIVGMDLRGGVLFSGR